MAAKECHGNKEEALGKAASGCEEAAFRRNQPCTSAELNDASHNHTKPSEYRKYPVWMSSQDRESKGQSPMRHAVCSIEDRIHLFVVIFVVVAILTLASSESEVMSANRCRPIVAPKSIYNRWLKKAARYRMIESNRGSVPNCRLAFLLLTQESSFMVTILRCSHFFILSCRLLEAQLCL